MRRSGELSRMSTMLARSAASRARLQEILSTPRSCASSGVVDVAPLRSAITIDRVSFAYDAGGPSTTISPSSSLPAGPLLWSGRLACGKSTLLALLMRCKTVPWPDQLGWRGYWRMLGGVASGADRLRAAGVVVPRRLDRSEHRDGNPAIDRTIVEAAGIHRLGR